LPDDIPEDPQQLLDQARHDCCTEMPPEEIKRHQQQP
jgi:hypothetical protein